jgi:hypothetical protein
MESVEFFKRSVRMGHDDVGASMSEILTGARVVFVPIFDGHKALSATMKHWLLLNFPDFLDDFLSDECEDEVRIGMYQWWYYSSTAISGENSANNASDEEQHLINFFITPIIKRSNHRKHNSHEWFFDSICEGLHERLTYVFLTDCGTTYSPTCLAYLVKDLHFNERLIGTTARQRVAIPGGNFHPCEATHWSCFKGDHAESGVPGACWKCWAAWLCSPCPLQGYEYEATQVTMCLSQLISRRHSLTHSLTYSLTHSHTSPSCLIVLHRR